MALFALWKKKPGKAFCQDAPVEGASAGAFADSAKDPPGASFSLGRRDGVLRVALSGDVTVQRLDVLEKDLSAALRKAEGPVIFDLSGLRRLDTSGALFLNLCLVSLRQRSLRCDLEGLDEAWRPLLERAVPQAKPRDPNRDGVSRFLLLCNDTGRFFLDTGRLALSLTDFFGRFLHSLGRVFVAPGAARLTPLIFHMEQTGLRAVPIVALLTFLIGLVVAYMGAQQLALFGAQIFAVNLLEATVLREMAVLITSIVVAGRSSSSFTAQIGAMVANEEVDALRSMGLNPFSLLVTPRVLALILTLPMLVFLADVMALLGGAAALWMVMDLDLASFVTELGNVASINNFFTGFIKTPFFAAAIGLVGCFHGFRATGSAESVGFLTTVSVVQSIFAVILLDALFAIFFMNIGL